MQGHLVLSVLGTERTGAVGLVGLRTSAGTLAPTIAEIDSLMSLTQESHVF